MMQFLAERRRRLLILGVVLVLITVSRSFLYANFVQPIALFLWAAWRVMTSVHQSVYWTLLLAGGLLPLLWMIFSANEPVAPSAYHLEPLPPGRVEYWEHLLAGANGSQKERERFREEWKYLLQSVAIPSTSSDMHVSSGDDREQTGAPPEAPHRVSEPTSERGRYPLTPSILLLLPESLQRRLARFRKTDDRWIRESLRWMESELDIPNGN